jgi:hypothetical protein
MRSFNRHNLSTTGRWLHPLALAVSAFMTSHAHAAPVNTALTGASLPLAGSVISNMALGEYIEEGSTVKLTSRSNLVETTILPVQAFRLDADRSTQAVVGQQVLFSHELRNTGNIADSYQLTLTDPAGGITYSDAAIYYDRNRDGQPDGAALTTGQLAALPLDAGETIGLLVGATIPVGTTAATYNNSLVLSAKSSGNASLATLTNNDSVIVSGNAVVVVRKSFSVTEAPTGTVVTVRLDYQNTSSTASGVVTLTDDLSANKLLYQTGTALWSGGTITDAAAGDASGINYQYDSIGRLVTADISSVPANSSGYITFQVAVNSSTALDIPNTVGVVYDPDNNTGTANNISTTSNKAVIRVPAVYGVVINAIAGSASQLAADNIASIPQVVQGGVATYNNYVWNTGNTTDTFNLTPTGSNLPAGSVVEFFRDDGATPILDSNGDGIPDTGPLAAGASFPIVVKVRFATTQTDQPAQNYSIFPQAQSIASAAAVDTVEDRTNELNSNLVDLIVRLGGRSQAGVGNGNIDNAGSPFLTLSVAAGGTVVYPIRVVSIGAPTSYNLSANTGLNFNNLNLPAGVSVTFARAGASNTCSPAVGNSIGATDVLSSIDSATPDQYICAVVNVAAGTPAVTATPLYFRAYSPTYVSDGTGTPTNSGADIVKVALTITNTAPAQLLFTPDLRGQIDPNGTIIYTHTLINQGSTIINDTQPFVVSNDRDGFSTTLYYDANDNGVFDATDPIITDLDSFSSHGSNGLDAGESIRIFAKVQATGTLTGTENKTVIQLLNTTGTVLGQVNDVTMVSQTLIRLTKLQALDTDCNGVADGSYTSATLPIQNNSNGTGQCVLYRLTVRNEGTVAIGAFNFRDATPAATVMSVAPSCANCTSTSAPATGSTGSVTGQVPSIAIGASHEFNFGVQYNGR